jgi:hypothetical protein
LVIARDLSFRLSIAMSFGVIVFQAAILHRI